MPRRLLASLGAFEDVEVIPDPDPAGRIDSWRAHRACLEAMPADVSHLLLLQDDAQPVACFADKYVGALAEHPDEVLCLFAPGFSYLRRELEQARNARERFRPLRVGAFVPCVAISYPRVFVEQFLDWVDNRSTSRQRRELRGADDGVLALYCRTVGITPLLLIPSIVEHDYTIASIGKSHPRPGPHRRAAFLE